MSNKGTLIYFNSGSIYTNCNVYTGLTSTNVTGITSCTGMTTGDVCDLQNISSGFTEIYVRLDCEGCCDKTYRVNLDTSLCASPTPTPTISITPSITPTISITPTLTPTPTTSQTYNSLGWFFGIGMSPTGGCALFTGGTSPNTEYFTFGFSAVDFYTNPVGKIVYVDSPPFGFGPLGDGYIVSSGGCRYQLTSGVVYNAVPCSPGGSCTSS